MAAQAKLEELVTAAADLDSQELELFSRVAELQDDIEVLREISMNLIDSK